MRYLGFMMLAVYVIGIFQLITNQEARNSRLIVNLVLTLPVVVFVPAFLITYQALKDEAKQRAYELGVLSGQLRAPESVDILSVFLASLLVAAGIGGFCLTVRALVLAFEGRFSPSSPFLPSNQSTGQTWSGGQG